MTTLNVASSMHAFKSKVALRDDSQGILSLETINQKAWRETIDKLAGWQWDIEELYDEGIIPPSEGIIQTAIGLSFRLNEEGYVAPSSVVPDGDGGVVFTHRNGVITKKIHLWDDGSICLSEYEDASLVRRTKLPLA